MAYIMEKAGGTATNAQQPILDVMPETIHERVQVILGSPADVQECLNTLQKTKEEMTSRAMAQAARAAEQAAATVTTVVPVPPPTR